MMPSSGCDKQIQPVVLLDFEKMWWTTCHTQKDGRVNLGTVLHYDPNCFALRGHETFSITGTVVSRIKKCGRCSG